MIVIAPEKVRAARMAAGFRSVSAAARATRLNYKTIQAFEGHGDEEPPARPKLETLLTLATNYNCTPRDFAEDPAEWDRVAATLGISNPDAPAGTGTP